MKDSQKNSPIWSILSKRFIVVILLVFAYLAAGLTLHFVVPAFTWHWFIFGLIAVVIPAGLICFYDIVNKIVDPSSDQKKQASKVFIKYTVFYWFADCLYMAIFNGWTPWIFALGILFIVLVLINLANAFLSNNKRNAVSNFFVVLDLVVGLVATVYLIYIIPQELLNLQSIVTTIVAAVYGGLLTLVGVAWTIRHNAKEKELEEIKRLKDIQELERKKNIPYVTTVDKNQINIGTQIASPYLSSICDTNERRACTYNVQIKDFYIKNISDNNIILQGICLNGDVKKFTRSVILEKSSYALISTTNNQFLDADSLVEDLHLCVKDMLGNEYKIYCHTKILSIKPSTVNYDDGQKIPQYCQYAVDNVDLPCFLSKTT